MAENTRMKDLETKVDTMMIVMEKRIQREDQIMAAIQHSDERMKMLEQSMINLTSLVEARQNAKVVGQDEINSAGQMEIREIANQGRADVSYPKSAGINSSAGSEEINSSGQIEMDSILNDISNKLDILIARLLQPFPASSLHCDKLSNVVSVSASNSLNDSDEKANLNIDVSCKAADRVVGEIGGKFACNTSELQGDKVALQLFDEMPKKDQNSYIDYGDLSKSSTINSIMAATDLLPQKDVGEVQMTYNHKNESKHGHMNFFSNVDATLCVTTSALVCVDGVEGICVQTGGKKTLIFDPGGRLLMINSTISFINSRTVDGVLQACAGLAALQEGRCVHGFCFKIGIELSFVNMYSKCDSLEDVVLAFEELAEKDVVSYTAVVGVYARKGLTSECLELFRDMMVSGLEPDGVFIGCMLTGFVNSGSIADGKAFHGVILKRNFLIDTLVSNLLISMYCKFEQLGIAENIFYNMFEQDTESWNLLICGYGKKGSYVKCLDLFRETYFGGLGAVADCNILVPVISSSSQLGALSLEDIKPTSAALMSALSACSNIAALHRGAQMHIYIREMGLECDASVCTALVGMYAKCGQIKTSREIFDSMPVKDIVAWNVMISAYGIHGYANEALEIFKEVERSGFKPNGVTFLAVLSACSHGELIEEGKTILARMSDYGIASTVKHYACLVDILGRSGNLSAAETMVLSMPIKPDGGIWGALLGACRAHNNVDTGEHVAKMALESDPENEGYYTLLSNMFGSAGRLKEQPVSVLQQRTIVRKGKLVHQALVQWEGLDENDSSWEDVDKLEEYFPEINLEDKVIVKGGVM